MAESQMIRMENDIYVFIVDGGITAIKRDNNGIYDSIKIDPEIAKIKFKKILTEPRRKLLFALAEDGHLEMGYVGSIEDEPTPEIDDPSLELPLYRPFPKLLKPNLLKECFNLYRKMPDIKDILGDPFGNIILIIKESGGILFPRCREENFHEHRFHVAPYTTGGLNFD